MTAKAINLITIPMLPENLRGPCQCIYFPDGESFLEKAFAAYPGLHPDFLRQACCEHPDRMDAFFPLFDIEVHPVVEREVTADWVAKNVRYDDGESLEGDGFYGFHFAQNPPRERMGLEVYNFMIQNLTWPFSPIIVESGFAEKALGCDFQLGSPFHLFEGTHRVSYLLKMLSLGLISGDSRHSILEIRSA